MFEEKPKPATPTEEAKAYLATKKKKKVDTSEVQKLKKKQTQRNSREPHIGPLGMK